MSEGLFSALEHELSALGDEPLCLPFQDGDAMRRGSNKSRGNPSWKLVVRCLMLSLGRVHVPDGTRRPSVGLLGESAERLGVELGALAREDGDQHTR